MMNTILEKTIKGLKCCAIEGVEACKQCPYNGSKQYPYRTRLLLSETVGLLEAQAIVIASLRDVLNTLYGKEAPEELK